MSKKISIIFLTLALPAILIILLIAQAMSQNSPKDLNYSNVIPKDQSKNLITLEGKSVEVMTLYEKDILFVKADEMMKVLKMEGHYDQGKNAYVIGSQDFLKRKVYQAKDPSTKEVIIFIPLIDLLKALKMRYTLSELGTYPSVRIQTSDFALATPTPIPGKTPVATGTGGPTGTPTPSPQQVYSQKCSKCHALTIVTQNPHGSAEWPGIVGRCSSKQAGWITDGEAKIITDYLSGGGR